MENSNKYLVIYKFDGELMSPKVETALIIFTKMDMSDYFPISIAALWWINETEIVPCKFYGTWCDGKDPLRMEIRNGETTLDVGYGTDH